MKNIFLFHVVINGSTESAYNSSIWVLSVWYDPEENSIFTMDSFRDIDTISDADSISDAMTIALDFFKHDTILTS